MNPSELKAGDRVRVTLEGKWVGPMGKNCAYMEVNGDPDDIMNVEWLVHRKATFERLPPKAEPLRVGEEIAHFRTGIGAFNQDGRVLFVDGDYVALKSGSHRWFAEIKDCKRRNKIPITTDPLDD